MQNMHCSVPRRSVYTDDGNDVNIWANRQRGKKATLTPEQQAKLEALPGWSWDPLHEWWQEMCNELGKYALTHGNCLVPTTYILSNGKNLGHWVNDQRKKRKKLSAHQVLQLESTPGWMWDPVKAKWQSMFNALLNHAMEHGDCNVPYSLITENGKRLGAFVTVQRARRSELGSEREKMLESLPGWTWDPALSMWNDSYKQLQEYVKETGCAKILSTYRTKNGYRLGDWVRNQRKNREVLSPEQVSLLESLVGWRW